MTFLTFLIQAILSALSAYFVGGWLLKNEPDTNDRIVGYALTAIGTFILLIIGAWVLNKLAHLSVYGWWFEQLGYAQVWDTQLRSRILLFIAGTLISFFVLILNQEIILRIFSPKVPEMKTVRSPEGLRSQRMNRSSSRTHRTPVHEDEGESEYAQPFGVGRRVNLEAEFMPQVKSYWRSVGWGVRLFSSLAAFIIALFFGGRAANNWQEELLWLNQQPTGKVDPVHGLDFAYYLFSLPFHSRLLGWAFSLLIWTFLLSALLFVYLYMQARDMPKALREEAEDTVSGGMLIYSQIYLAALLVLIGIWSLMQPYWLMIKGGANALIAGASYIDIHYLMPWYTRFGYTAFLAAVIVIGALIALRWISSKVWFRTVGISIGGNVAIYLIGLVIIPFFATRGEVRPNEIKAESPYLTREITATLEAYDLFGLENGGQFPYSQSLTGDDFRANDAVLKQIRVVDWEPFRDVSRREQELNNQYRILDDVDVLHYTINGADVQVFQALREVDVNGVVDTWQTKHLGATHGWGAVIARVNEVTSEGKPVYLTKDIGPMTGEPSLIPQHPGIYFGEGETDWAGVNTNVPEMGPNGTQERYEGQGGLRLGNSGWRRLALAIVLDDFYFLVSGDLYPESRIMFWRTPQERLALLAPFAHLDPDPYAPKIGDRYVYLMDAYTEAATYPYAITLGEGNYVRHSIKATMDSYDGAVSVYMIDPSDPIVSAWSRIFPGLMKNADQMPTEVRAHSRYPEFLFNLQSDILNRYHVKDPVQFYYGNDSWRIADEKLGNEGKTFPMAGRFVMLKFPAVKPSALEFAIVRPFKAAKRETLGGWLAGRIDANGHGRLFLYEMPGNLNVTSPGQVEANIDNDEWIRQSINLWTSGSQTGGKVRWGNQITVPIYGTDGQSTMLFIKPAYLESGGDGKWPVLRRIYMYHGNSTTANSQPAVIEGRNLAEALDKLYRGDYSRIRDDSAPPAAPVTGQPMPAQPVPAGSPFEGLTPAQIELIQRQIEEYRRLNGQAPAQPTAAP